MACRIQIAKKVLLAGLAVSALGVSPALAVNYSWDTAVSGAFNDAAKWNPNTGFPIAGDTATFGLATGYTVNFPASAADDQTVVNSSNAVTWDLTGSTYNIGTGADNPLQIGGTASLLISSSTGGGTVGVNGGAGFNNAFTVNAGTTLTINNSLGSAVTVNSQAGATLSGTMTVSGAGVVYNNNAPGVFWQFNSNAVLNVLAGASVTTQNFTTNIFTTGHAINIDGVGSTMTGLGSGNRMITDGGSVNITGGGTFTAPGQFEMGVFFGSGGVVHVGDNIGTSTLQADNILFGTTSTSDRSFPEMKVHAGGVARATGATNSVYIYDRGTMTLDTGTVEIVQNGNVVVADNVAGADRSVLRGNGTIQRITGGATNFTVTNDGYIRPGDTSVTPATGTINIINGNLVQNAAGILDVSSNAKPGGTLFLDFAAGNVSDLINITGGTATIGGTIDFNKIGAFTPQPGMIWNFIFADSISINPVTLAAAYADAQAALGAYSGPLFVGVVNEGGGQVFQVALPEPASMGLLSLGGVLLLRRRRVR